MSIDWQRVKHLLAEAVARNSPEERAAYLDDACGGDVALRAQVEKLLKAHNQADTFLEQPVRPAPELCLNVSLPPTEKAGDRIGPYRLLQQIGEGGCGVVYMAEQEHPIRRRVALKVIKLGMDTKSVIARFEAERQALALMDHPNIAHVLDAGATDTGRPYFVMELVRGIKITEYCDQHYLSTEARLNLFVQVCHALQHAHQKGIIHRDIKPSNILVTLHEGAPMPKVIDFGIAKATDQRLTDKTLFTAFEQFIGTPAYMSPEQAGMTSLDIDTRSDIYALGVLLYELLTGRTPFDPKELVAAGLDGMRRIIREEEPKRPLTCLSTLAAADQTTVAKCCQVEAPQLIHQVRGDLDWIVMRCLEKDRARRYQTANNLAEDIERHLHHEPVMARPPSQAYQFQKLVQRNKGTFAAAGLLLTALVLGLGLALWLLAKERAARRQTLLAEQKAEQVARFLKEMLQSVGPSVALGRDTTMLREILDKTAARVGEDLRDQPEVKAELLTTLGEVYQALGRYDQAESIYREALKLQRALWGNMNTNVADSLDRLGHELHACRGEASESASLIMEALMIRTNLLGPVHLQVAASLDHLGGVLAYKGEMLEASRLFRQSLAMRRHLLGNDRPEVVESLTVLADTVRYLNNAGEAEQYAREALTILSRLYPSEPYSLLEASVQESLAGALRAQGKLEPAVNLLQAVVATRERLLGSGHPEYASALFNLGYALQQADRLDRAEPVIRKALAVCRKAAGDQPGHTIYSLETLGDILRRTGRLAEAEASYREALSLRRIPNNYYMYGEPTGLITLLIQEGKLAEAEAALVEAAAEAGQAVEKTKDLPASEAGLGARLRLVQALWRQMKVDAAGSALEEAMKMAERLSLSSTWAERLAAHAMRVAALEVWLGRGSEYQTLCRRMLGWGADQGAWLPRGYAAAMSCLRPLPDPELQARALALAQQNFASAPTNASLPWHQFNLGVALYRAGRYPEAQRVLLASQQGGPAAQPNDRINIRAGCFQTMLLFQQGQSEAARRLLAQVGAQIPPLPEDVKWSLAQGAECDDLILWLTYKEARELLNPP
jgi:serine/threonine protein kinase/Flp pilus assembly protein TadD